MYTSKTNGLIIQLKWKQIRTRAKDNITLSFMSYWNCIKEIKAVHISTKTEERVRYSSCGVIKRRDMNNKIINQNTAVFVQEHLFITKIVFLSLWPRLLDGKYYEISTGHDLVLGIATGLFRCISLS